MDSIQFKFHNRTIDKLVNHNVVIFQNPWPQNNNNGGNGDNGRGSQANANTQQQVVAWRVIQNCGSNMFHPFTFPLQMSVSIKDSSENLSMPVNASAEMTFDITGTTGDLILAPDTTAQTPVTELVVSNKSTETIDVIYSVNGIPIAYYENLLANTSVTINMPTELSVGIVSAFTANSEKFGDYYVLTQDNWPQSIASISTGISSADIYMMGGGAAGAAEPITFEFQNVLL